MSNDHSAAIEAGWRAYKNSWTPASPAERCEAAIRAAAEVIEADVRRKIAEDGARLLRNLLTEHLLTNGKCFPSQCGDPDDVIWSDHIADLWTAAIARGDSGGQA